MDEQVSIQRALQKQDAAERRRMEGLLCHCYCADGPGELIFSGVANVTPYIITMIRGLRNLRSHLNCFDHNIGAACKIQYGGVRDLCPPNTTFA